MKTFIKPYGKLYTMSSKDTVEDRVEVFKYICDRVTCDSSCKYAQFCPSMMDSVVADDCIIRRDYKRLFDAFYNLYIGKFDGLKTEMINIAYSLKEKADTPEEALTYFNSLTKIMSSCYAPEKQSKEDMITDILVNITPVGKK